MLAALRDPKGFRRDLDEKIDSTGAAGDASRPARTGASYSESALPPSKVELSGQTKTG
jgi:hypothetical protein